MRINSPVALSAAYPPIDRQAPTSEHALPGTFGAGNPRGGVGTVAAGPSGGTPEGAAQGMAELTDPILDELVETINRNLHVVDKRLQFLVHEASGRIQLRVLERGTDEVIREVPPERLLDLVGRIQELIGLLIDETA